jgi:hypothetical protein
MPIAELAAPAHSSPDRERRLRDVRALVSDDGCDVLLRGAPRADLERLAMLEWLPLSPAELAQHGWGGAGESSSSYLASLVRPPTVWPLEEAIAAARLLECVGPLERVPFAWLVGHARGRVDGVHLAGVRRRAARIAGQLPLADLPRASAEAAAGCSLISVDDEACGSVAAIALARYSLSEVVAREAYVLHLP